MGGPERRLKMKKAGTLVDSPIQLRLQGSCAAAMGVTREHLTRIFTSHIGETLCAVDSAPKDGPGPGEAHQPSEFDGGGFPTLWLF